ncbi:MAG: hypothetical protein QOF04_612 [Solirubrobacteraceae bacterium]|jgi:transcriptional regulatory protein LevR|nr:hypothetical protein [Solirubrobacteraceae bacterium]
MDTDRRRPSPFDARLTLLVDAGEVTPTARELTEEVVAGVEERLGVQLGEDRGSGLVTHLAMALTRVERGEAETTTIAGLEDELDDCERERDVVAALLERCGARLARPIPRAEVDYVTLHVCALREG